MENWKTSDSESLFNLSSWGRGFFGVNAEGRVTVRPDGGGTAAALEGPELDLHELVEQVRRRGVEPPILLRFDGILRSRARMIFSAFDHAREEYEYGGGYRGVYPIKVNQERQVVETLLEEGRELGMGLEVGSKPELFAGIALQAGEGSLMICNGYKDREYVEIALLASQLGIRPIIVIEKFTELATVLEASRSLGIRPHLGVRSKLSFRSSGRWQNSVGDRSKFGLTTREIVDLVDQLEQADMLDCLELLHFHIGSQISQIRSIKQAMTEATNILAGLHDLGARIQFFDVGGGLGVDYDGSRTTFDSSMNYSLQEYANDVVYSLKVACERGDLPEPVIVSESGRALAAHHAVLVSEVIGVTKLANRHTPDPLDADAPEVVRELAELVEEISSKNFVECYHDATHQRERAMVLFNTGQLSLKDRARAEEFYWAAAERILEIVREHPRVPEDLAGLERAMADTYFLNFSLFQSLPDSWAIDQIFPVLPIHRLDEEPRRRAILADMTCDSDGKVDRFIGLRDVKRVLEVHELRSQEPYYLGFFLVGAYQEILGDMHNLFGDTNIVHVDVDPTGRPRLTNVLRGDRVKEVLSYVDFFEEDLLRGLRRHVEDALDAGRFDYEDSARFWRRYEEGLRGYTYLTRDGGAAGAASPAGTTGASVRQENGIEDPARLPG